MIRALLISLCFTSLAAAGVSERDLFEAGDGLLTYDEVNGREWLDFSISSQVFDSNGSALAGLDETLSGFKLATLADVEALMSSASVPQVDAWSRPGEPRSGPHLVDLMGETGRFSGSILGDVVLTGGFVAPDNDTLSSTTDTIAVLAFDFGVDLIPGGINSPINQRRSTGYYRLAAAEYPFASGPVDWTAEHSSYEGFRDYYSPIIGDYYSPIIGGIYLDRGLPTIVDNLDNNGGSIIYVRAGDLNGNGVIDYGDVVGMPIGFGDVYEYNVYYNRIQGSPAYWLFREATPIPEPSAAWLAIAACLTSLRLRALA